MRNLIICSNCRKPGGTLVRVGPRMADQDRFKRAPLYMHKERSKCSVA